MNYAKIAIVGKFIGNFVLFLLHQGLNKNRLVKKLK